MKTPPEDAFINPGNKKTSPRKSAKRSYRVATPNVPTAGGNADTVVGVTLWRLRRATQTDSGERLIVHEGADAAAWLPERISANTRLDQGDRLRISVEAARTVTFTWLTGNSMPTVASASLT